jgi:predicted dinucleotide-binding enzyme
MGAITFGAALSSPLSALAQTMGGNKMKIATIGAGREGGALGTLFAKEGHRVMFSSRNPDQLKDLVASAGPNAQAGAVAEAVAFGDVVLLVVPYPAIEQIGKDHGKALAEKALVLDVSNPSARRDGDDVVKWVEQQGGAGLATLKWIPGAHLVRGFNAINFAALGRDAHRADPVGVPIAGDDKDAIALATMLIKEIGFEPVLVGGLAMGKYLVPGTPLGGEHTPAEVREIAAKLS